MLNWIIKQNRRPISCNFYAAITYSLDSFDDEQGRSGNLSPLLMLLVLVWHPSQKTNPVPSTLRGSQVKFWAGIQGPFVRLGMRMQTFVIGREVSRRPMLMELFNRMARCVY